VRAKAHRAPELRASSPFDEGTLRELRRLLLRAVGNICPRWLANDREDLVQTALVRLMETGRTRPGALEFPKAYARRVAYTAVVDEIRRRRRRQETPLGELEATAPCLRSFRPDPEALSAGSELGEAIRECLRTLSASRREALTLWLLGHKNREISDLLGWDRKRTENLVTRARCDLRKQLVQMNYRPQRPARTPN